MTSVLFMKALRLSGQLTEMYITDMILFMYSNEPKFLDKQVWANSVDQDQIAPHGEV